MDLGVRLEEMERLKAKARSGTRTDLTSQSQDWEVAAPKDFRETAHLVGEAIGMSAASYRRAQPVTGMSR